ncbi:clavesin-2-like [Amyelois transitella]|uniref:clavesin-2-like n=1 Tax=Amyelois transitella TaxID=680683 RepID=UPI00298F59EB|nr:clavesin-2-like [Amyelois transitella]
MSKDIFVELLFEAEVKGRFKDDPEFEETARRNCNEDPDTREKIIQELRSMIIERGQCHPQRMDDAYLLIFLRCRRFIVRLAHKLIVRYENLIRREAHYFHCNVMSWHKLVDNQHVYSGTLPENPYSGRTLIMRFGRWDPSTVTVDNILRAAFALAQIMLYQPRFQAIGLSVILDLEGMDWSHLKQFTPNVAYQFVCLMGVDLPILLHGLHIINYNWAISTFCFISKPFIPSAGYKYVHFHGRDMSSLHKHIDPASLPPEYGGFCTHVITSEDFFLGVQKYIYRDKDLVQEYQTMGYRVEIESDDVDNKIWCDDVGIKEP